MELKEKIIALHAKKNELSNVSSEIKEIQSKSIQEFETLGFPTNKLEAWKYTSLETVLKEDYNLFPVKSAINIEEAKKFILNDIESYNYVFVNGHFNEELSKTDKSIKNICLLSDALKENNPTLKKHFNTIVKEDNLTSLNTAFCSEGVFVHVPKSTTIEKTIQIVHFYTGEENALLQPRNLVVAEPNSHVKIIERHQNLSSKSVLTNTVTEIYCDKDSNVDYYKIQNDTSTSTIVDNTYINQKSNTLCSVHTFSFGGHITRNNLNFFQNGEYMDSILKGVTILNDKQHVDHYTLVRHIEPNCESHQDYKGIYSGVSKGVFNGKIYVEKEAQKTDAYQQNANVLLTDTATINAKPQLEIFADDVKCSHGCTIGQLDNEAIFYMQQRGIPKKQAQGLLTFAFANSVLESVKIPELKELITDTIAEKLDINIKF